MRRILLRMLVVIPIYILCCLKFIVGEKIALIVSSCDYHYEVVLFFSTTLSKLGLLVHLWLHESAKGSFGGEIPSFMAPWSTNISYIPYKQDHSLQIPANLHTAVYISMDSREEAKSLCFLQIHQTLCRQAARLILVNHQAHSIRNLVPICHAPRCLVMHIAQHVHRMASAHLQQAKAKHVYSFALNTVSDIANLLPKSVVSRPDNATMLAIQGNMVPYRRNYQKLFQCLSHIQQASPKPIQLHLIGSQSNQLYIPEKMKSSISIFEDLSFSQFYAQLSQAHFLLTFSKKSMQYNSTRGSSSIPTAVMTGVPLVLPVHILRQYDCLSQSPVHRLVGKESDCLSLQTALQLSAEQYRDMREETQRCEGQWIKEAHNVLERLLLTSHMEDWARERGLPLTSRDECQCL